MPDCSSIDSLATAYVDGELAAGDRQALELHLRACAACRVRVAAERAVRGLLQARKPALCEERAPQALRRRCEMLDAAARLPGGAVRRARPAYPSLAVWQARLAPMALAATLVLIGGAVFLYRLTGSSAPVMAAELTADHVKCFLLNGVAHPDHRTTQVEQSLASKFGWSARLPDQPEQAGLELVGERTCLYGHGLVAHIMYRHEGRPVSVFMLPKAARREEVLDVLGHGAAVWSVGDRTFVLVAREPRAEIERMASFVRAGLR